MAWPLMKHTNFMPGWDESSLTSSECKAHGNLQSPREGLGALRGNPTREREEPPLPLKIGTVGNIRNRGMSAAIKFREMGEVWEKQTFH